MKAAVIQKENTLVIQDVMDIPPIREHQCYCRNLYASACSGTDMKLIQNAVPWGKVRYPAVLGHETVGEVLQVGAKVRNFQTGDLVLRPVYGYTGQNVNGLNNEFGGFSEYGIITDYKAMQADGLGNDAFNGYAVYQMKIPTTWKEMPESVLLITVKETFSWIQRLGSMYGKNVGVIGVGAVGMFFIHFAAQMFASSVTAIARSTSGKARAMQCGANSFYISEPGNTPQVKFDVLIDAAGVNHVNEFLPWIKPGGVFAFYGLGKTMDAHINGFGSGVLLSYHNSAETDPLVHDTCIALVDKGLIDLTRFHSTIFPFASLPEAFEKVNRKEEFKPIFTF